MYMIEATNGEKQMFIENDITYVDAIDYAEQNTNLIWSGDEDSQTALNDWYFVITMPSGKVWCQAGSDTWEAASVEDGKQGCQADYQATYGIE